MLEGHCGVSGNIVEGVKEVMIAELFVNVVAKTFRITLEGEGKYYCECDSEWHIERVRRDDEVKFVLMGHIETLKKTASYLRGLSKDG